MRKLIVILIISMFLSVSTIPASGGSHISVTPLALTKGSWSAYPLDYSYHLNWTDMIDATTIDNPVPPPYISWLSMLNDHSGTRNTSFTPVIQSLTMYDSTSGNYNSRRAFIEWNMSGLPLNGVIKNATINVTWNADSDSNHWKTYIVLGNSSAHQPKSPFELRDYGRNNYILSGPDNRVISNQTYHYGMGMTTYGFNRTGKYHLGINLNNTNHIISFTTMFFSYYDVTNRTPTAYMFNGGVVASKLTINMTVVISGSPSLRITPPPGPPPYIDPRDIMAMLQTLLWFIGLGGMVIIPMMVYAKAKEKGDIVGRFNGSVVFIGFWIICLGFFLWAIL